MTIVIIAALIVFILPHRSKESAPRVLDLTPMIGKRQ